MGAKVLLLYEICIVCVLYSAVATWWSPTEELNCAEKVAIFLLEESQKRNSETFTLTKSRQEIADSFAIQKFSLQRCLNAFAAEGAILLDGKHVTIVDKQKLKG